MAIVSSLPGFNLFSSLPSNPPPNDPNSTSASPSPQIPIPKYPPPLKKSNAPPNSVLKNPHHRTKYYKQERDGVISSEGDCAVIIGENGMSYLLPGAPFEFQFSYSETPNIKPLAIQEPPFLPFAPPTMPRPWTGKAPLKSAKEKKMKRKVSLLDSFGDFGPLAPGTNGVKQVEMARPVELGKFPKQEKDEGGDLRRAIEEMGDQNAGPAPIIT